MGHVISARKRHSTKILGMTLVVALALLGTIAFLVGPVGAAHAAEIGFRDASFKDGSNVQVPTDDKAQSKLWYQDGAWWGLLYSTQAHATTIQRLSLSTQTWSDTGTVVDGRPTARGDALWDSGKLYVVSATTVVSEYSSPPNPDDVSSGSAQLLRYSYDAGTGRYTLDSGFPTTIHNRSTESITIARESTGKLWVTYTVVAADNTSKVYVQSTQGDDTTWGTAMALPTTTAAVHYDDISAIVAFQGDKVGVMWSNQLTKKFYFAVHRDGQPDSSWQVEVAYGSGVGGCSTGCANDHVNLKQLSSDGSGRVFAAVKTANRNTGQPFVVLLVRDGQGAWTAAPFGAVEDLHTRPLVMVDEEHRELFMFAVSPEVGGSIYYKKTPLDHIAFEPGVGTPFIQSTVDTDISNPTSTKQNLNGRTGLVILASANSHGYYWHNYLDLNAEAAPPPAAPTNLTVSAPLKNADSSLVLSWADNSTNEEGFSVERRTAAGSYQEVARTAAGTTTYADTALTSGTTYTYRVRAYNSVGPSLYSAEASGTTAQAGPVRTFVPVADAYVDSGVPNTNYGTKTNVSIDASPVQEAYLKFVLSGLSGNTVTSAKLRLYDTDNGSVKGGSVARMSTTSWTESGVTYNNHPTVDGPILSTLGAVSTATWYELDVTGAVQGDGTVSLGLKTSSSDGVHYASREDSAHAPQLVVTVTAGDSTPPDTTIETGPTGTVPTSSAAFTFSANEAGSTFECRVDTGAFAACTSPKQYSGLPDGAHVFSVRAIDASGNIDGTPATRSWTSDTASPATVIDSTPAPSSSTASAQFVFHSDEAGATFSCRLDAGAPTSCSSPAQLTRLADGSHTFTVSATDSAGNVEQEPPSYTWTVDTVAPDTTILTGPQGSSPSTSSSFTFSSEEVGASFTCSLDGSAFAACSSPASYTDLTDGDHTFAVRATDAAGNTDPSPATRVWTVATTVADTTPPTVSLTSPEDHSVTHGSLVLSASATDDVGLDHVDFLVNGTVVATDGTSPYSTSWNSATLPDGSASIVARAVDTSANTAESARTITVDNTAPDTTMESGPSGFVSSTSASFVFSSGDTEATFECSLDGAAYAPCSSPQTYAAVGDGSHTFTVRAKDVAGNVDVTPASRDWTVDVAAPDTTVVSGPSGTVVSRSAAFTFSSTEAAATFECSLDGASWSTCSSPQEYSLLSDGAHQVQVRARDAAGNVDASPATRAWTVDPVAFSDGFESGDFSRWTSVHTAIDGTAKVQSGVVRSGAYAAQLTSPSSTSYSYLRQTLAASQTDLTVSGDFDITAEGATGQEVPIFKLYDASSVRVLYVYRRNVSGRIYVVYGGTTYASTAKLSLGSWASFSVHTVTAGSAASRVEVTMNGSSIYSTTTASLGTAGVRTIQVGNDKQLPFALYTDNLRARI